MCQIGRSDTRIQRPSLFFEAHLAFNFFVTLALYKPFFCNRLTDILPSPFAALAKSSCSLLFCCVPPWQYMLKIPKEIDQQRLIRNNLAKHALRQDRRKEIKRRPRISQADAFELRIIPLPIRPMPTTLLLVTQRKVHEMVKSGQGNPIDLPIVQHHVMAKEIIVAKDLLKELLFVPLLQPLPKEMYILSKARAVSVHKPVVATSTPEEKINLSITLLPGLVIVNE